MAGTLIWHTPRTVPEMLWSWLPIHLLQRSFPFIYIQDCYRKKLAYWHSVILSGAWQAGRGKMKKRNCCECNKELPQFQGKPGSDMIMLQEAAGTLCRYHKFSTQKFSSSSYTGVIFCGSPHAPPTRCKLMAANPIHLVTCIPCQFRIRLVQYPFHHVRGDMILI